MTTNQELMTTEQQKAIIDTNKIIDNLDPVIDEIATIKTLKSIGQLLTITSLVKIKKLKESKAYVGMPYIDEDGNRSVVRTWAECCKYRLKMAMSTIDKSLLNLSELGEEALEAMQRIGLGDRELRKLRQTSKETQELIVNSKAVKLGNKEEVQNFIEDEFMKHKAELTTEKQRADEAEQTIAIKNEMLGDKQQELDQNKEREAERKFSQDPWRYQATDALAAIINARTSIAQGVNQIIDVLDGLREYDEKSRDLIAKSLLSEVQYNFQLVGNLTNDTFGALSDQYSPELPLDELYNLLHEQSGGAAGEMGEHENTISPEELAEMNK